MVGPTATRRDRLPSGGEPGSGLPFYAGITSGEIVEFERTLQRISDNLNRFESDRAG
jgi:hypothetical protein